MDYSKWDQIADSDEENESRQRLRQSLAQETFDGQRQLQVAIDNWLRRQISRLPHDGDPTTKKLQQSMPEIGSRSEPTPVRQVSKREREVLAMLISISHFEEGDTNLDRHPMILDLVRHNRWLEEDPGTLELLCRIHNNVMREGGEHGRKTGGEDDPELLRMRNMLMCGINTIAAPKRTKCPGGLLELFTLICTPETDGSRELRKKWQMKDFAKDALFDSLFPDLRQYADDDKLDEGFGSDFWIIVVLGLLAIVGIIAFVVLYYNGTASSAVRSNASKIRNISNASLVSNASAAAAASAGGTASTNLPPPSTAPIASPAQAPSAPAPAPAPPAVKLACTDSNEGCAYWAQIGECTNNAEFMLATCRLSCGVCKVSAPAVPPAISPGEARAGEL